MNKKTFRKKWVEALRSDEYEQGQGTLCTNDKYCCLGVACDLAVKYKILDKKLVTVNIDEINYDGQGIYLPEIVRAALGLSTKSGVTISNSSLANMNDCGCTFKEIADFIDSNPKGLFVKS